MEHTKTDGNQNRDEIQGAVERGDLTAWECITKIYDNNETLDDFNLCENAFMSSSLRPVVHCSDIAVNRNFTVDTSLKCDWPIMQNENCSFLIDYNRNERVNEIVPFQYNRAPKLLLKAGCLDKKVYPVPTSHIPSTRTDTTSLLPHESLINSYCQDHATAEDELHPSKRTAESRECLLNQTSKASDQNDLAVSYWSTPAGGDTANVHIIYEDEEYLHDESSLSKHVVRERAPAIDGKAVVVYPHEYAPTVLECVPPYQKYNDQSLLLKPLNSYNYFYRDERDNIIQQITNVSDPLPAPVSDFSNAKLERLLKQRLFVDPLKAKRVHRKTHGKIGFRTLSTIIADRWKQLPRCGRDFYRKVANKDEMFYQQHIIKLFTQNELS